MERVIILVLFCVSVAKAEFRIWENEKGQTVEAELVAVKGEDVVLKNRKGKMFTVQISSLSESDQGFAIANIRPDLSLDVKKRVTNKGKWDDVQFYVKASVRNEKGYSGRLKAVFVALGKVKRNDRLVIMDLSDGVFDCKSGESLEISCQKVYYDGDAVGVYGYALLVLNESGIIIGSDASKNVPADQFEVLLNQQVGQLLNDDYSLPDDGAEAHEYFDMVSGRAGDQEAWTKRLWFNHNSTWHAESGLSPIVNLEGAELIMNVDQPHPSLLCQLINRQVISPGVNFSIRAKVIIPMGHIGLFDAGGQIGRLAIPVEGREMQEIIVRRRNGRVSFSLNGKNVIPVSKNGMKMDGKPFYFGLLVGPGHGTYSIEYAEINFE